MEAKATERMSATMFSTSYSPPLIHPIHESAFYRLKKSRIKPGKNEEAASSSTSGDVH